MCFVYFGVWFYIVAWLVDELIFVVWFDRLIVLVMFTDYGLFCCI